MTPEILKLYEKLQPLFREKMGPFQSGDRIRRKCTVFGDAIDIQIWPKEKMKVLIVRDRSSLGTYWYCQNENGEERILTEQEMLEETCLRLPLPIDPVNPERGLWGMVDWSMFFPQIGRDGRLSITREGFDTSWCSPEIALLKTLIRQEGL